METFLSLATSVSTFEEKPTLDELCEHIVIGAKWYHTQVGCPVGGVHGIES